MASQCFLSPIPATARRNSNRKNGAQQGPPNHRTVKHDHKRLGAQTWQKNMLLSLKTHKFSIASTHRKYFARILPRWLFMCVIALVACVFVAGASSFFPARIPPPLSPNDLPQPLPPTHTLTSRCDGCCFLLLPAACCFTHARWQVVQCRPNCIPTARLVFIFIPAVRTVCTANDHEMAITDDGRSRHKTVTLVPSRHSTRWRGWRANDLCMYVFVYVCGYVITLQVQRTR